MMLPWQLCSSLFLLISSFHLTQCARVLFTFYHDRGSHFGSMLPMMEKISSEHSVTLLHTFSPQRPPQLPASIRMIVATLPQDEDDQGMAPFIWNRTIGYWVLGMVYGAGNEQLERLVSSHADKMADLFNEQWDLIVMDDLFWCFGFLLSTMKQRVWDAQRQGPEPRTIIYSTAGQSLLSADSVRATSRNWVSKSPLFPYIPSGPEDAYSAVKFTHRLHAFYENAAEHVLMNGLVERFMLPNIARYGVPGFSWYEMYRRSSLQFGDSVDRMGWPLATAPDMVNVGAHCKSPNKLPAEFAAFMEDPASEGTIYVAFGTYPEWSLAPGRILDALLGAFQRLASHRVIFAYNGPPIAGLGKHVMLAKWAPQLEILSHPSMRAYITHGGLKSVREGLCAGVPLIVMPLFAEQAHNAHLVLAMGIGPVINKYTLAADSVHETIHGVVSNPDSMRRAHHFRAMFIDRPMAALDEGLFYVNRLMRAKPGRRVNFVRKGMDLNWVEFVHADLALLLLVIVLVTTR